MLVDNFCEPSYESGRAVRWKIELASGDPFGIACLWDRWTDPASGVQSGSFTVLTVNADGHAVTGRMHRPDEEKRMPVIVPPVVMTTAFAGGSRSVAPAVIAAGTMPTRGASEDR